MIAVATILAMLQCQSVTLPAGLPLQLATVDPLSSRHEAKGDMVALKVAEDVIVAGETVIPAGTAATGQIAEARSTGGLGVNGRLAVQPLYLRVDGAIVRLTGVLDTRAKVPPGSVVGLAVIGSPISGKSATIPPGTRLAASVQKPVTLCHSGTAD